MVEVEACPEGLIPDCAQECVSADWLGDSFCDPVLDCALTNQDEGDCPAPIVDVEKGATSILSWDDGESAGTHQYQETPERYYEYARFEIEQPVRIWSLQAQLAIPAASTVTFYLWDDFGGNPIFLFTVLEYVDFALF